MTTQPSKRWGVDPAVPYLVLSALALGHALQIANGFYHPVALLWLTGAILLCGAGVLSLRPSAAPSGSGSAIVSVVIAAGIAWQIAALLTKPPGIYLKEGATTGLFRGAVILEAALIGLGIARIRTIRRLWFPAVLIVQLFAGVWLIHASPSPRIDTVVVHRAAIHALLHAHDPYRITFENIYGAATGFYNPQAMIGGRVAFGYPYPPLSLILAAPGQALAGDYRYAELAALVIGAACIGYTQAALTAKLAASLLLTTPRVFFVLEQGWTEPIGVLLLGGTVFCLARRPSLASWAGGLLVVTKQYLALAGPLLLRYAARCRTGAQQFAARAAIAGLAVTLPFALWHPQLFIDNVVRLQAREPFRSDSLSYLSWAVRAGWGAGSFAWSIAAALIALVSAMIRTPNTPAGFAGSLALSLLAMFAFGSKAFCNYYFFVIAAICCAIAAYPYPSEGDDGSRCSPDLRAIDSSLGAP